LASVAQDIETNGRQGLPLLGLIPIIGRLFTAPTKDNRQVDIVIAITPRVIRAPAILPEDIVERPTGALQTPTSGSLEAMIVEEEREEMLALARRLPTDVQVQLPDQPVDAPSYVRSSGSTSSNETAKPADNTTAAAENNSKAAEVLNLKPIDTSVKTLQIAETADRSSAPAADTGSIQPVDLTKAPASEAATPELSMPNAMPELKRGEKAKIAVAVKGTSAFRSATLGLRFDDKRLAVRSVTLGEVFGSGAAMTTVAPFINNNGKMFVSLSLPAGGGAIASSGVLAIVEVEALQDGPVQLAFEREVISFLAPDGRSVAIKF